MTEANISEGAGQTLAQILTVLAGELGHLAHDGERLQNVLGRLVASTMAGFDDGAIEDLQRLDTLVQKLRALSGFVCSLSDDVPRVWRMDSLSAIAKIDLSDLARKFELGAAARHDADSSDCELFKS